MNQAIEQTRSAPTTVVTLNLPYPPSVNHVWRHAVRGKHSIVYKSADGKDYTDRVIKIVWMSGRPMFGGARLAITVEVFPPDRRARDLGNLDKVLMDSLQAARVFDDDSQIDDIRYVRREVEKSGKVLVHINQINQMGLL